MKPIRVNQEVRVNKDIFRIPSNLKIWKGEYVQYAEKGETGIVESILHENALLARVRMSTGQIKTFRLTSLEHINIPI